MEHGHSLVIPPHFDGNNYAYWKVRMKAFLKSIDERVWNFVEYGWEKLTTLISKWQTWCVHYWAIINSNWNKIGVYIMRQIKKFTWLQACFLGDVRVIWCNSLGDSHFQTYVMNFVKIVIDHYLLITSHVSHAIASCTHYTSYSLLNLVHDIVCDLVVVI